MKLLKYINSETNILSVSIGKKYLYDIAGIYLKNFDNDVRKDCIRDIDNFVYGICDKKLLSEFRCPEELITFFNNEKELKALAERLDRELPVWNDYEDYYDFHEYLLRYMIEANKRIEQDRKSEKMHLCFSYEPQQPSDYRGLEDTKVSYDSILCKFHFRKYIKHTKHKQVSQGGCAYFIAFTYLLILTHLHKILKPCIEGNISEFLWHCLSILNPVIVGFTMTSNYDTGKINAMTYLYEFFQLNSKTRNLIIEKNKADNTIKFIYVTLGKPFNHSTRKTYKPLYITDDNGKRNVQMLVSGKGHTLTIRFDFVGLSVLYDVLGKAVDRDLFSMPADDIKQMVLSERTLFYMLSHTDFRDKVLRPEKLSYLTKILIEKFKLKKYEVSYVIIAVTLAMTDEKLISKQFRKIGSAQQAKIRKMVNFVRDCQIPQFNCLTRLDKGYSWWQ